MAEVPGIEESKLYVKTEELLREYKSMQARLKNLQLDLANMPDEYEKAMNNLEESSEEIISGMYYRHQGEDGMPRGQGISDKTAKVALTWRSEHQNKIYDIISWFKSDRQEIEDESSAIEIILAKIDNALATISSDEQIIIRGFYLEKKPWYDVAHEVQYVERHCKRLRTRAIWYMSKSIFGAGKVM